MGKLDGNGDAKGKIKLDEKEFRAGGYDVWIKTAAGKESPKVGLTVNAVGDVLIAGLTEIVGFDSKTGRSGPRAAGLNDIEGLVVDQKKRLFAASAAGGKVVSIGEDGGVRDLATGIESATELCNDPDTNDLYVVGSGGLVVKINPDTGAKEMIATGLGTLGGIAYAEGFIFVAFWEAQKLCAIDKKTKRMEEVLSFPLRLRSIVFDENGAAYVCGMHASTAEGTGRVWRVDLKERKIEREFKGFTAPYGLFLQGNTLFVSDRGVPVIKKLDLATGQVAPASEKPIGGLQMQPADRPYPRYRSQFQPSKGDLYGGSYRGEVYEMDRKTGKKKVLAKGLAAGCGVAVDTKGRVFVVSPWGGTLTCIDPETGAKRNLPGVGGDTFYIACDPETDDLYVTNCGAGTVRRVNPETGAQAQVASGLPSAMGVAVCGDYLFVGSHGGRDLSLVHKKTGAKEVFLTLPSAPSRLALGGDDELWVTGNPDQGGIFRISISERKILRTYPQPGGTYGCVWEEDRGKLLLANNFFITRLDPATGQGTRLSGEAGDHDGLVIGLPKARKSPPKPKTILVAGTDANAVFGVNPKTGAVTRAAESGGGNVMGVVVDQKTRIFMSRQHSESVGRVEPNGTVRGFSVGCQPSGLSNDPDTNDIYVLMYEHGAVLRVNPETGAKQEIGKRRGGIWHGLAYAGGWLFLTAARDQGKLLAIDRTSGRTEEVLSFPRPLGFGGGIAFDSGDAYVGGESHVYHVDMKTRRITREWAGFGGARGLYVEKGGKVIVAEYHRNCVSRLDPFSGQRTVIANLPGGGGTSNQIHEAETPYPRQATRFTPSGKG